VHMIVTLIFFITICFYKRYSVYDVARHDAIGLRYQRIPMPDQGKNSAIYLAKKSKNYPGKADNR
jgi:hypothetical protein